MSSSQTPPDLDQDTLFEKLLDAVQLPVWIAKSSMGLIQFLCIAHCLTSVWLTYFLGQRLHFPLGVSLLVFVILVLPAAIIGRLYLVLLEVAGLAEQIMQLMSQTQIHVAESHRLLISSRGGKNTKQAGGFKLTDLFSLEGQLLEIKSLGEQLWGLKSLSTSMMAFANPLFLGLSAIALVLTLLSLPLAAMTLLIFLL